MHARARPGQSAAAAGPGSRPNTGGAGAVVSFSGCVSLHCIKHEISLSCKCMQSRSTGLLACTHLCAYGFCCYIEKAMDMSIDCVLRNRMKSTFAHEIGDIKISDYTRYGLCENTRYHVTIL